MVPKRVDSTNQNRLPANAHAHRAVFQARLAAMARYAWSTCRCNNNAICLPSTYACLLTCLGCLRRRTRSITNE